jgi:hypothetical protein
MEMEMVSTYWYATMLEFSVRGRTGLPAICSEVNHSGEMKGATAPAILFWLNQDNYNGQLSVFDTYSETGSRVVMTNRGKGGSIEVIVGV